MACFVDTEREFLALRYHMSWLNQQTTRLTQAFLPAQQISIFKHLLLMSPSNKKLLAADAHLRQTHLRKSHIVSVNLSQCMKSVFVTFLEQGNAMPIQRQNCAGIADAYMDLYDVHKIWPKVHRHRIRILHGSHWFC